MQLPEIRLMKPIEWAQVRDIRLRALEESPDAFGSTLERESAFTAEDWINRLERKHCATFMAFFEPDAPCGMISVAPYGGDAGLFGMWVDPDFRGKGIGGALVEAVKNWAQVEGFKRILLDVGDFNLPAVAFYKSRGFIETGVTGTLPPPREHISEHQLEFVISNGRC